MIIEKILVFYCKTKYYNNGAIIYQIKQIRAKIFTLSQIPQAPYQATHGFF